MILFSLMKAQTSGSDICLFMKCSLYVTHSVPSILIWNDLPDDVRSAKSLSSFRKKLKTYLFEKAYPP